MTDPARFGSQARFLLAGSEKISVTPASLWVDATPFTVSVILRRKTAIDTASLGTAAGRLTREQFAAQHGPRDTSVKLVKAFAKEFGLNASLASGAGRRTVRLTGAPEAMQRAFGVTLGQTVLGDKTCRVREGAVFLPEVLIGHVEAVLGLDNRPQATFHARARRKRKGVLAPRDGSGDGDGGFTPVQVAQLYGFPAGATADGQTVGILALAGGYRTEDLVAYFGSLELPVPSVTAVSVGGAVNSPSTAGSEDRELMMDIEVCAAVAPGVKIVVYFAPNTDDGFADAISTAVHDTVNRPGVLSISWGGPESSWTAQSVAALDGACQAAAALGVTITAASGDLGSSDGPLARGPDQVDFPASSPHVLACGGTTLTTDGATILDEVVWNGLDNGLGASGGGVSAMFPLPSWQSGAQVPAAKTPGGGRGVPDVCGHSDIQFGYAIRVDGVDMTMGGTSAVAPLWAGLIALANKHNGGTAGFINPTLYSAAGVNAFRDITVGNNGSFTAGPGWDACTGLGSPVGAAVIALLAPVTAALG